MPEKTQAELDAEAPLYERRKAMHEEYGREWIRDLLLEAKDPLQKIADTLRAYSQGFANDAAALREQGNRQPAQFRQQLMAQIAASIVVDRTVATTTPATADKVVVEAARLAKAIVDAVATLQSSP